MKSLNLFLSCALLLAFGSNVYAYTSAADARKIKAIIDACAPAEGDTGSTAMSDAGICFRDKLKTLKSTSLGPSAGLLENSCKAIYYYATRDRDAEAACYWQGGLYLRDYLEKSDANSARQYHIGLVLAACTSSTPKNSDNWLTYRRACLDKSFGNDLKDATAPRGFATVCRHQAEDIKVLVSAAPKDEDPKLTINKNEEALSNAKQQSYLKCVFDGLKARHEDPSIPDLLPEQNIDRPAPPTQKPQSTGGQG